MAALLALALAGCGNWSMEDVRFLAALPTREDLRVRVPASAQAGALAACDTRPATTWAQAKPTSDSLNAAVDFVIALVETVRRVQPTERRDDERRWGPWDSEEHPGRELRVIITRREEGDALVHDYAFEARVKGQGAFVEIITGTFRGPSAEVGTGTLRLNFDVLWTLGLNDADTPRGALVASYDRTGDPRTVAVDLTQEGFGVRPFEYRYSGWAEGSGWFEYRIPNGFDTLTITAGFDAAGAGRDRVAYVTWLGGAGSYRQCWDAAGCLVYVDDAGNYSCEETPEVPSCSLGAVGACPSVPLSPF